MSDVDLSKFKALYIQTAMEYLKMLEENLLVLTNDSENKKSMDSMYIAAHSLKSQSLLMGYNSLAQASLSLEKTFRALRDGIAPISQEVVEASTRLIHGIRASLTSISGGKSEVDLKQELSEFNKKIGIGG